MKYLPLVLAGAAISSSAHATVTFHSDFDEANLGAIAGLNIDTPAPGAGQNNDGSGTVALDTVSQRLDLTAADANMWTTRDGAPIAWVSSPGAVLGETWYVQTQITHTDSTGANSEWDQAGILFYSGTAGANPGSESVAGGSAHNSLFAGINDWNAWTHTVQGFGDNIPNSATFGVAASLTDDTFEYRVEITENGAFDTYNFFYREEPTNPWTQYGPTDLSQDFNNAAVGLFLKSHNNNLGASTEFDYLTVGIIPEPGTGILALAGLSLILRRRRS